MREDLVGYFLGALDPDAAEQVERQLGANPAMRRELDRIGCAMRPLAADADTDPPVGLAERTIRRVMWLRQPEPMAAPPATAWRLTDLAIAASILLMFSIIIFPALNQSRQQRQIVDCSYNMRSLGVAMESYAERFSHYLPFYSTSGPYGVAGIYAPLLIESQLVTDRSTFICPSSGDKPSGIYSLTELRAFEDDVNRMNSALRTTGGSYGSLLGFKENGVYRATQIDRSGGLSILVDRPRRPSEGDVGHSNSPNHNSCGQNALCRDGSVRFFCHPKECPGCDDFYISLRNRVEPGRNPTDLVFGTSEARICCEDEQF